MANKHANPLRNGIIVTVVGGLILSTFLWLRGFLLEAMSQAWSGVKWIWLALISDYSVPGWVLFVTGIFALVALVGLAVLFWILRNQNEPAHRNYTEDMLYGAKWCWSWNGSEISNLWCFCPICDSQLVYSDSFEKTIFICERCPPDRADLHYRSQGRVVATVQGGGKAYAVGAATREILRRIRTGERATSN